MMRNKYILAIDSFKGCLTSAQAEQAAARAIADSDADAEIVSIPMSDGGEGMLDAFTAALGGRKVKTIVHDPLMRRIEAEYGIVGPVRGRFTAIVEIAQACGLNLLSQHELNPLVATSYGVGELIVDAARCGCTDFIVGLGGSGTSDCGIGMLRAIIERRGKRCFDEMGDFITNLHFTLACDVANPLCGDNGAARVFAPQKGATAEQICLLERRAKTFAIMSAKHFGRDCSNRAGAGAAGGLGYAFMQYLGAEMKSGTDLLLETTRFDEQLHHATLVITGEGSADRQTLMGKLPLGIMRRARSHGVPTCLVAGKISDVDALHEAGFDNLLCINPVNVSIEEAMKPNVAQRNIYAAIRNFVSNQPGTTHGNTNK